MHEFSIVQSMVETTEQFAADHHIDKVAQMTVQIGALTGVLERYVRMYYDDLVKDTCLEDSELIIENIPAEAFCRRCGQIFDPTETEQICPACAASNYELLHGDELLIKEIGYKGEDDGSSTNH